MFVSTLFLLSNLAFLIHGQAVEDDWTIDKFVSTMTDGDGDGDAEGGKPISTVLSELTKRAGSEFDRLYHQLEGVVGQLTSGVVGVPPGGVPSLDKECRCYCRCPRDKVRSKVMDDVKLKLADLKDMARNVGKSIKDKIHDMTAK